MKAKSAVAGLIVAALLGVTSAGAACDVSCTFAPANADCHSSGEAPAASATGPAAEMGDMNMAGMDMPGMHDGQNRPPVSQASRAKSPHISSVEMGLCERQFCGKDSFIFARASRSGSAKSFSVLLQAPMQTAGVLLRVSYSARDSFAARPYLDATPPTLILRV